MNLELEAVTIGFAFKSGFFLPMNASNFWNMFAEPFDIHTHPIDKRSIGESDENGYDSVQNEKFERHQAEAEVIETGTEGNFNENDMPDLADDFASTRWLVYKGLAEIAEK